MQMSASPMTPFWSTDSALHERPSPQSNMLMSEVKAEAVPCLQVGFALYKHMHISYHDVCYMLVTTHYSSHYTCKNHIELHLLSDHTAVHIDWK